MKLVLTEKLYSGAFSVVHKGHDVASADHPLIIKRCCDSRHARREFRAILDLNDSRCRNIAALEVDRLVSDNEIDRSLVRSHKFYTQAYDHPSNIVLEEYDHFPEPCRDDGGILEIAHDVLTALCDIHGQGYVHCDVKRENIMFDADSLSYRLIDFGLAMKEDLARLHAYVRGTPFYLAPEIVQHGEITRKADMYAVGVLIYSLLHECEHPIHELNLSAPKKAHRRTIAEKSYDPARWRNSNAPRAEELCKKLLQRYPPARPSAEEALEFLLRA